MEVSVRHVVCFIVVILVAIVTIGIVWPESSLGWGHKLAEFHPPQANLQAATALGAAEKHGWVIATEEAYEEVFGSPSIADTKYGGVIANPEAWREAMKEKSMKDVCSAVPWAERTDSE